MRLSRAAVVDIGSNSIHLLIAERERTGVRFGVGGGASTEVSIALGRRRGDGISLPVGGILVAAVAEPDHWWLDVHDVLARRGQLDEQRAQPCARASACSLSKLTASSRAGCARRRASPSRRR